MTAVRLRPPQVALVDAVTARVAASPGATTVGLLAPGAGKTLSAIATHVAGVGLDLWDRVGWYTPRLTLAAQAEADWAEWSGRFASPPARVLHRTNDQTLTPSGTSGFASTYQSLVTAPDVHLGWARANRGRFLLVADECQWLGADGSTAAGEVIEEMQALAAGTLLMTGTPYRSDGLPLVGCDEFYRERIVRGERRRVLAPHVSYRYQDGVRDGNLRRIQADLLDAELRWTDGSTSRLAWAEGGERSAALRDPEVWAPIVERTVDRLRDVRATTSPRLQALVAAADQDHAREIAAYVEGIAPDLRVGVAVSDDGEAARRTLVDARAGKVDVLVAVGMAYVGYDCPTIAVVGLLTRIRHPGWLEQCVGRGLRVWSGLPAAEQTCVVVGPADGALRAFVATMRAGSDSSALREKREAQEALPLDAPEPDEFEVDPANLWVLDEARFDKALHLGSDADGSGDLSEEDAAAVRRYLEANGLGDVPETVAVRRLVEAGLDLDEVLAPFRRDVPVGMTVAEARREANREVRRLVAGYLRARGATPGAVAAKVADTHRRLNRQQRVSSSADLVTVEQCLDRVELAREWLG